MSDRGNHEPSVMSDGRTLRAISASLRYYANHFSGGVTSTNCGGWLFTFVYGVRKWNSIFTTRTVGADLEPTRAIRILWTQYRAAASFRLHTSRHRHHQKPQKLVGPWRIRGRRLNHTGLISNPEIDRGLRLTNPIRWTRWNLEDSCPAIPAFAAGNFGQ